MLLNTGIARLLELARAGGGTAYDNANARIGVGNGTTGTNPTMTGLQGASTAFIAMQPGYPPAIANQTITFYGVFAGGAVAFEVAEIVVDNGAVSLLREVLPAAERFTPGVGEAVRVTVEVVVA